ncbi:RNA polymerase sigma factor [Aporhodopirellula aestuarii]|uniref:RNA polymerase sigma factor n=1 Tax=Aporhodopirellula aestuarii TaxID=2950107 RepID=A0ABT0U4I0_9BACT|nr:RNA polymerase sigma factor [Aporhodopirellula aestuarii]MCM2371836.1 RNA polymerase sigma factor [Aporhodopirellula aestuarii]
MSPPPESFAVLSNAALVDRCRQQDEAAFTEIFERHRQMVYRVCLRYLGHHHDAEDITQETFRRAALALPRVESHRPLEPWLVTIAANRCRTFLSRRRIDHSVDRIDEAVADTKSQPDVAQRASLDEQLTHALRRLPDQQRQAFELVHGKELSYPEAASVMGRSTGTVKTWVRRAKLAMQNTLGGNEPELPSTTVRRGASTRKAAATWVASLFVLAGFWIGTRGPVGEGPVGEGLSGSNQTASVPGGTFAPSNETVLGGLASDATSPLTAPENPSIHVDWQLVSLDSFSRADFTVDDIHALPVADWVQETKPTINHLRMGIEPLGKTLQRVAYLFQCDLAATETSSMPRNSLSPDNSDENVNANGNGLPDAFHDEAVLVQRTLTSVS